MPTPRKAVPSGGLKKLAWVVAIVTSPLWAGAAVYACVSFQAEREASRPAEPLTPAEEVAVVDGVQTDAYVEYSRLLVRQLSGRFPEDEKAIAYLTRCVQHSLAKEGHQLTVAQIMKGVDAATATGRPYSTTYAESVEAFASLVRGEDEELLASDAQPHQR